MPKKSQKDPGGKNPRSRTKEELERLREHFAVVTLETDTISEAARRVGVSRPTARRWAQSDDVKARVRQLARRRMLAVRPRLAEAINVGLNVLMEIAQDPDASKQDRVNAARFLAGKGLDAQQSFEIDEKLDRVMAELNLDAS